MTTESDNDEPKPSPPQEIPQQLHGASEWVNFVYRVWLHDVPPEVAARIAFESGAAVEPEQPKERDVRAEINDLYRQHFPDSENETSQSKGQDHQQSHEPPKIERSF